jgi:hypothetical protein
MRTVVEPSRTLPVRAEVDVLVVGGGPAGIMAAQAASGNGLKVMLIEGRSYLGGNLTIGLPILGFLGRKGNQIIKGLPQQFVDRLRAKGGATGHRACPLHVSLTMVDPEKSKDVAYEIVRECGIQLLLNVFCSAAIKTGNTVNGVIIESKAGREAILAKTVIDCTGDGDVATRAGAFVEKGDAEGGMQPPTTMFSMKGIDIPKLRREVAEHPDKYDVDIIPNKFFLGDQNFTLVGMRKLIKEARSKGYKIDVDRTIIMTGMAPDEMWVNMSHVSGVDGTEPSSETAGEIEARLQNYDAARYLIDFVPGFENAWIDKIAPFLGIRESRRIVGEYMLTGEDILACRHFEDVVAVASYPIDLHHPKGGDCTLTWCEDCYDIPYRCLVPKGLEGLLLAGRCASTTHEAMASTRVMSTCMAMGEAAGKAAKLAVLSGVMPSKVDVPALQKALLSEGVYFRPKE